ncbi:DUF3369 domain-containing protein [Alteromonas oceanisediminis]|uniref:DUF3369 domain-containing protein n=1 Tax=Alteromonas oceanisediminis TaxID=2836180 RepID=UPI001BDA65FE|nr:DUF3369 domain-containing protein [Alteromonas oceanisediminis]MBT0587722.1 DUF3369 domain-containing protein [Alteromonas oceanisediminis]
MEEEFVFAADDYAEPLLPTGQAWKLLIIDDEPEIHTITRMVMADMQFDGRHIECISAYSASQAREILSKDDNHDIALAIVDVVMETQNAGLELIEWVRTELNNHTVRLVLRTGQPGEAPEESVIRDYDINDYKNKTELTALRLKTVAYSALRSYRDIKIIERHRSGLERIIAATSEFIECETLPQFASTILRQISVILGLEERDIVCCAVTHDHGMAPTRGLNVLATNQDHLVEQTAAPNSEIMTRVAKAIENKQSIHSDDCFIGYFTTNRGTENLLYVSRTEALEPVQHHLLEYFAHNIAVAHENLSLRETIKESQRELSYVIGEAVEMRSRETGSHVRRVAHISYLLAKLIGMNEHDADMIKLASPLHDVGKVGIPDKILNKPGKHDADEWEIMQEHAQIGYEMLQKSHNPILKLGATIAQQHHECWDGTGYPNQLKGKDIHIAGRISAVADVFDVLGSRRCYKEPWPMADIVALFKQERGTRFDPALVDALLANLDDFIAIRERYPD